MPVGKNMASERFWSTAQIVKLKIKQQLVMNSLVFNNNYTLKRRFAMIALFLVGISATVLAGPIGDEDKLTKEEAEKLIELVKEDLKIEAATPEFIFDEEGLMEETSPLQIVKIFDKNDVLLLEAPINTLKQTKNKHLRRLLNASDFLIKYNDSSYYRLDI